MDDQDVMEVYFDESGYTGEDLDDLSQSNLLLAAVAIPGEIDNEFWERAAQAWGIASRYLGVPPEEVELKGTDIYGGKGQFRGLEGSTRLEILEVVFTTVVALGVHVYWDGLPKHSWQTYLNLKGETPEQHPLWKKVLVTFCDNLYQLLTAIYPGVRLEMIGDENSWVNANKMLEHQDPDRWCQLARGGVGFYRSSEAHGIQVADVVVHTLYRANRDQQTRPGTEAPVLSNTDLTAKRFHARLVENGLLINVSTALHRLDEYCNTRGS